MASKFLSFRQTSGSSSAKDLDDDEALGGEDVSEVTKLFFERLAAWKHACGYVEEYVSGCERMHTAQVKELEKLTKTVSTPLREAHHFDQQVGGISEVFDGIRGNTMNIEASHTEVAKQLKAVVLPIFERLHAEIKAKQKEIQKGVGKSSKSVDKWRGTTQKHIEQLGAQAASVEASGGAHKLVAEQDPYVKRRLITHSLNKQVLEENATRQDTLQVQSTFSQFEAHVVQTMQQGMQQLAQTINKQLDSEKALWGNMATVAARIDPLFEWNGFIKRNEGVLIDPQAPPRDASQMNFPNQDHGSTKPLIQGSLERKGKLLSKYEGVFCAVTPARFLHEFKSDDDIAKEPNPTLSLYLPDCLLGGLNGTEFSIKGKNSAGGKVMGSVAQSQNYSFRAHTHNDAQEWYRIIVDQTKAVAPTSPVSPVTSKEQEFTSIDSATTDSKTTQEPEKDSGVTGTAETAGDGAAEVSGETSKE